MSKLNEFFSREEFACKCGCGFDAVDVELLTVLTDVRLEFGPVTITSGNRCVRHNAVVGGATDSMHTKGMAADFTTPAPAKKVQGFLEKKYPNKYGVGRYTDRTHVDVRPTKARWEIL